MPGIIIKEKEEPKKPPISISMDPSEAKGMAMGDEVTITVKGKIHGIHSTFDDKFSMIELVDHSVESISMNKADKVLKDMKKAVEVMNEADRGLRDSLES